MKKIFKLLRGVIIFGGWTALFLVLSNGLINAVWRFDFMAAHSWAVLSRFWNQGGVIKTTSDILLITSLVLLPLLWFAGFLIALKLKYIHILLAPLSWFDRGRPKEPERIVLKNMKSTQKIVEDIKNELDSLKPKEAKEAGNIRSVITQKLEKEIKK